jgi:hypothetical protein
MIKVAFGRPRVTNMSQASQHLVERSHGVDGVVFEHVRVDALGDDGVVPHHASDRDERNAGCEKQADRGASAVVQPDPAQSSLRRETLEAALYVSG